MKHYSSRESIQSQVNSTQTEHNTLATHKSKPSKPRNAIKKAARRDRRDRESDTREREKEVTLRCDYGVVLNEVLMSEDMLISCMNRRAMVRSDDELMPPQKTC